MADNAQTQRFRALDRGLDTVELARETPATIASAFARAFHLSDVPRDFLEALLVCRDARAIGEDKS